MAIKDPEVSCGISIFPKTKKLFSVFADIKWFLAIACFAALVQGGAHSYYKRTMHVWRDEYGFSEYLAEWLIVSNELLQGILALFIINTSDKKQRIVWIAGSMALLSVAAFTLLIPELVHPLEQRNGTILEQFELKQLCQRSVINIPNSLQISCWTSLIIMFIFQAALGASMVSLYVHSTLYIDDHETTNNAIALIGFFLSFKELGAYLGVHLSWLSVFTQGTNIFVTPVWITLVLLLMISASFLSLYPKYLSEAIKLKAVVCSSDVIFKPNLRSNLKSVFANKPVVFNIFYAVFLVSAISNFSLIEHKFVQSKFLIPDEIVFHGTQTSQIVTSIVKPILVFSVIIISGFIISKFNIRGYYIAIYNTVIPIVLMIFFVSFVFLNCEEPRLQNTKKVVQNWCSSNCNCEKSLYEPVCFANNEAYFSPCYAGCSSFDYQDGIKVFKNCLCGTSMDKTTKVCASDSCDTQWIIMVSLRTVIAVLTASVIVGHTAINLHIPHFTERSYVLAIQSSLVGLIAYGPIRAIYLELINTACRYEGTGSLSCNLHESYYLSQYIISITAVLLICAAFCSLIMTFLLRKVEFNRNDCYLDLITPSANPLTQNVEVTLPLTSPVPINLAVDEEETTRMLENNNSHQPVAESEVNVIQADVHNQTNENKEQMDSNTIKEVVKDKNKSFETSL